MTAKRKQINWLQEAFGLDRDTWAAAGENTAVYNNAALADTKELIRMILLYCDRSATEDGYNQIFKYLHSLPEHGRFPDWFINRFICKRQIVYTPGDRVKTDKYGYGKLEFNSNGSNWAVRTEDGAQHILNEDQFILA